MKLRALSTLLALAPLIACAQGAAEKSNVHIAVGGRAALAYLPLTIAEQLGYLKAEGLEIRMSDFAGGSRSLQAVIGGGADVVSGAYEHTITLQAKGQQLQCFVMQGRLPLIAVGVATHRAASYKSPKDLRGMKIGVSAPGSTNNMVVDYLLAQDGLKPEDVSIIGIGNGAGAIAAMKSGRIDAIANTDPVMTKLELDGEIRIVADLRTMKGAERIFGGPMPAACLYAPIEFIRKNPHIVQALANAIVRADHWLQKATAQDVARTVPASYALGDVVLYQAAFEKVREAYSPDGLMPEAGPKTTLKALAAFNPEVKPEAIKLELTFTNEFARKANARYR